MAATQTLLLGSHARTVQQGFNRVHRERVLQRLWDRDASLWSANPAVQASIRQRLGWLTIPQVMRTRVQDLQRLPQELRHDGITHALLLGMGGSGLFSEVCRKTFGVAANHLELAVLDTTDPTAILAHQRQCPLTQLLAIVSSKSGSTSEVSALSAYFYGAFASVSRTPGTHCLAITDEGTSLQAQASTLKFRRLFLHGPQTGADVGGRFSALTYFGLVPAALMGVDVERLLHRALEMLTRCGSQGVVQDNPAAQLGAVLSVLAAQGYDKLTLLCPPSLSSVGTWVEQLVAESTGKAGKGIVPIFGEPLRDVAQISSDRIFVEFQLASEPDDALERYVARLERAGHPIIRVRWEDRYDLGGEVMKWSVATAVAGYLMGIDPFDEPNVKESKDRTNALLDQYASTGRLPAEVPWVAERAISLYGASQAQPPATSMVESLATLLRQRRPHDYVTILSFLPRTKLLDRMLQELRNAIGERLRCATVLGIGPRYLHSTGQLYKGGPDQGVFLLITGDDPIDLPIPGASWTFGILKQAQALGDVQAMQQRGRRLLRLHLHGSLDGAAQQLRHVVDDAIAAALAKGQTLGYNTSRSPS